MSEQGRQKNADCIIMMSEKVSALSGHLPSQVDVPTVFRVTHLCVLLMCVELRLVVSDDGDRLKRGVDYLPSQVDVSFHSLSSVTHLCVLLICVVLRLVVSDDGDRLRNEAEISFSD